MKTTRLDKNRVAAANLASRELEITRNEFNSSLTAPGALAAANFVLNPHPLPGQSAGADLKVDGDSVHGQAQCRVAASRNRSKQLRRWRSHYLPNACRERRGFVAQHGHGSSRRRPTQC